ncbi:MAG: ATP-grasp domain-containing protein [Clostridiales bacterium]|nr:ATP-grasp domain-containing protein [Clostridiales bacterium]
MKNVLVFPCGSEIGLEVNRALAYSKHFTLYGGNSVDDHGKFVYKNYISGIPFIDKPNFIDEINRIVELYKIDFIIPAHDSAVLKMAENQSIIKATIITSCADTCKVCRSKGVTYEVFQKLIPTPKVYEINEQINFPIFLKPDVGQGTKGTYKVNTKEEAIFYFKKDPTLLALEYLPGKEYTVDCFTDKNGQLLFAEGRERIRINNGISVNSKQLNNPKFQDLAEIINQTLSFQGVWFYQVKERANGELVLMEIAPRIAGTMALFRAVGINFIQLSLFDRMGFEVSILNNKLDIEIDRALFARFSIKENYDYVYIDFDDTIIVDNGVNTDIIKFLYQARNMGKKIILLTKHKQDIKETLSKFAISDLLFDDILLLEQTQNKSGFIKNTNSIFIDDSFAERKEVFDTLKIPVFGLDAVESLLFWKV